MHAELRRLWARTRLLVWPEPVLLVSLPVTELEAVARLAASAGPFAAIVVERDEASLTLSEGVWRSAPLRPRATGVSRPLRAITLDLDLELSVVGYLAPAAARLAEAGVSIVPQCAFRKDHLLVDAADLDEAVRVLESLVRECSLTAGPVAP